MAAHARQAELLAIAGGWIVHACVGADVLRVLAETAARMLDAPAMAGAVTPGEGVVFSISASPDGTSHPIAVRASLGAGPVGAAVEACEPYLEPVPGGGLVLTAPLMAADGDVLGMAQVACPAGGEPDAASVAHVAALVHLAAVGLARLRLAEEYARLEAVEVARIAAEARYRQLYDRLDQGVVYQDATGRIIDANPAARRILGRPCARLLEMTSADPDWRAVREDGSPLPCDAQPAMVALRTGQPVRDVVMGIWHQEEDRRRWILVSSIPECRQGDERPWRVFSTFSDITERRETQLALAASEQRFRSIFEAMSEGMALHDIVYDAEGNPANYRLIEVNPRYEDIIGLKREDVVGKLATEVYGTPEPPYLAEFTGPGITFETYFPPLRRWFVVSVAPIGAGRFATIFFDVTRLREAEEEARAYRDRLNAVLITVPAPVFAKDARARFTLVNPAFEAFFGRAADAIIGRDTADGLYGPATAVVRERDAELLARGGVQQYEHQFVRRDGAVRDMLVRKAAITDDHGGVTGIVGTMTDVTDFRRMEDALRRSEARYRALFESARDAIYISNAETGLLVDVNPEGEALVGRARATLLGMPHFELLAPEARDAALEAFREAASRQAPIRVETVVLRSDGARIPVEISSSGVFRSGEEDVVLGAFRDISARRAVESALQRERALLTTALDILPFPIFFRTPDRQVFLANRALRELTRPMGELPKGVPSGIMLLDVHTRTPIPMEEWPEARAARGEVVSNYECIIHLPDGREFPIIGQAGPIRTDGEIEAVVVAFQDITALKAADRAKDEFLAVLSHELRTPLTTIIGWTQAALDAPDLCSEALAVINRSAQHQRRLIEDLIDISRVLHGKLTLRREPLDLWRIAEEAVQEQGVAARERGVTLQCCAPGVSLPALGDRVRLRQVVTNLLDNAIKHTPARGRVTVCGQRTGGRLVLTVVDTGVGMTREELGQLFTPFRQVRPLTAGVGLGLGLALVRAIVEGHDGTITAESAGPGQGAMFTVTLPAQDAG